VRWIVPILPQECARLITDNEIVTAFRDEDGYIQIDKLDNVGNDLVYRFAWKDGNFDRDDIDWSSVTTADLDADGREEVVSAFRDDDGEIHVVSLKNAENDGGVTFDAWWSGNDHEGGHEFVDIAAGNLTREANRSDEVVVALKSGARGKKNDLEVIMLDGTPDGGLTQAAWWHSADHDRGDTYETAIATGDLDGDGYNDEIVVAIEDGRHHLQLITLAWNNGALQEEHWMSWNRSDLALDDICEAGNERCLDVTTGDVDGDYLDEVVLAVQDGEDKLQIIVVDDAKHGYAVSDNDHWYDVNHGRNDVWYVSVAAGDVDGDGADEIVSAFQDDSDWLQIISLDYLPGAGLMLRGSWWSSDNELDHVYWPSVAVGDIDRDVKGEIVVAVEDNGKDLQVLAFDDNLDEHAGQDNGHALHLRSVWQDRSHERDTVRYVGVALGDVDGDSYDALNGGVCTELTDTRVVAMVNLPPYWDKPGVSNADGLEVTYGTFRDKSSSQENSLTTSYSSQVSLDLSVDFGAHENWLPIEAGPQLSWEWGRSLTYSWGKGVSQSESKGWKSSTKRQQGFVVVSRVRNLCYQYRGTQGAANSGIGWRDAHRFSSGDIGHETQGAGADFFDINGNGRPDLLTVWMDNPPGENNVRYAVAWDVREDGTPTSWSDVRQLNLGWGHYTDYLGAAVADINHNGRPDLVVLWIDDPDGANTAYYRVGWDLDAGGVVRGGWSPKYAVSVNGNHNNAGAGLDIADINGDGQLDMVFAWIDDPSGSNGLYYRIGWTIGADGRVVSWGDSRRVSVDIGHFNEGLGVTIGHFDNDQVQDILFSWVDNPDGDNVMYYLIGEDLNHNGVPASWQERSAIAGSLGWDSDGAFLAATDLVSGDDGWTEPMVGWVDNPAGGNQIVFRLGRLELIRVCVPSEIQSTFTKDMDLWNSRTTSSGGQLSYADSWVPAYRAGWKATTKMGAPTTTWENQGLAGDFADFDHNGTPDLFLAWVDNPSGANKVLYRVGWNVNADGQASWSGIGGVDTGFGDDLGGLGAGVADLNGNGRPEVVLGWVDAGDRQAYYRVGWDVDAAGVVSRWDAPRPIGLVTSGQGVQGVGLDLQDLDGNGRPELIFGYVVYLPPTDGGGVNRGYYRIGWDMDPSGHVARWGGDTQIKGAFGTQDQGLGLTVADSDADGRLEVIVNWVRNPDGENLYAYVIGDDLGADGGVDFWVPGVPLPGWVGAETAGAAAAMADLVGNDGRPEMLFAWVDNPAGENSVYYRIGQYWPYGNEQVDQFPTDMRDTDTEDGFFEILRGGQWWQVRGSVIWTYSQGPILVSSGGGDPTWELSSSEFKEHSTTRSQSYSFSLGGEAKFAGVGVEGSHTWGWEQGATYSVSWGEGFAISGATGSLPPGACSWEYKYVPFLYVQQTLSNSGVEQDYSVLDYYVPARGCASEQPPLATSPAVGVPITPTVPVVNSPTHPDPLMWYPTSTVVLTWTQPAGDPATITGYRWYLDHDPATVPATLSMGVTGVVTYENISDGLWYFHIRARGANDAWGPTAHRMVRVDTQPPTVTIALDPGSPTGNNGWYVTPITVTITANDAGAGVQQVEYSTDGVHWLPYLTPLHFTTDISTTLWARATDMVGRTSSPVTAVIRLDRTPPSSKVTLGGQTWGAQIMQVITDTLGNQHLLLGGPLTDNLSGWAGMEIRADDGDWLSVDALGSWFPLTATPSIQVYWFYTGTTEIGRGVHHIWGRATDQAGNVEAAYEIAQLTWYPEAMPDLSGSAVYMAPRTARPGEVVTCTIVIRNGGWQDARMAVTDTLPAGLTVLTTTLDSRAAYDPVGRAISWTPFLLWPGEHATLSFRAVVDSASGAATLENQVEARAFWPGLGTASQRTITATLDVVPDLSTGYDNLPPRAPAFTIREGQITTRSQVHLHIEAEDARWMYIREWAWDTTAGNWVAVQDSGWVAYTTSYTWTLSQGDGVKYLGVWVADANLNVSSLTESSLEFTNYIGGSQSLAAGQRVQYRFHLRPGDLALFTLIASKGDPDLYLWSPLHAFRPDRISIGVDAVDALGFWVEEEGLYLLEVGAQVDSKYRLAFAGDIGLASRSPAASPPNPRLLSKMLPMHPLTVSDPLSAGVASAPSFSTLQRIFLPLIFRSK